jgi:hypothetical protein
MKNTLKLIIFTSKFFLISLYFIVVILIISSETAEENSSRIDEFPFLFYFDATAASSS